MFAAKISVLVVLVMAGLKVAVRPLGSPVAVSATLPLKPPTPVMPIVMLAPVPPAKKVSAAAEDEMLKLGAETVKVMILVLVMAP